MRMYLMTCLSPNMVAEFMVMKMEQPGFIVSSTPVKLKFVRLFKKKCTVNIYKVCTLGI